MSFTANTNIVITPAGGQVDACNPSRGRASRAGVSSLARSLLGAH